jgi:LPS-assembly lipoprotein
MSSSDRRRILALMAAAPMLLAGCGFAPVYGPGGTGGALRGRLAFQAPEDRLDFVLVSRLEERLGRAASPSHRLGYAVETSGRGLAITGTNDITRNNITGTLRFQIIEIATEVQVQAGAVTTFTAYSTTGSPVATAAARRDAEDRLMLALADQLVSRLLASGDAWT